jgi:hypothetical protein
MREHVTSLCERHEIIVKWCRRTSQAHAINVAEEITIAPVRSAISYATALHEIGHILGRHQRGRRVMIKEDWAWRWAKANALMWTPRMERHRREAMRWYSQRAKRFDREYQPPVAIRETSEETGEIVKILLDLTLPGGKALRDATFAECRQAGGFFTRIAKLGKPDEIVGKKLTDAQVAKVLKASR